MDRAGGDNEISGGSNPSAREDASPQPEEVNITMALI